MNLETGELRNRYELILNYDYTHPDTGERKTGRIEGELTSGLVAPTHNPYPTCRLCWPNIMCFQYTSTHSYCVAGTYTHPREQAKSAVV